MDRLYKQSLRDRMFNLSSLGEEYYKARVKAATAEKELNLMIAANYDKLKLLSKRSNFGVDMGQILIVTVFPEFKDTYTQYIVETAKYKSLEKQINILQSHTSLEQSIIKAEQNVGGA